jgi:hypothetical protein
MNEKIKISNNAFVYPMPITLTMPDNNYWKIGDFCGKAWSIGKEEK